MKLLILYFLILSSSINSQSIRNSILGKPKMVKEYVVFLNKSGPYTFMSGDGEYGHAVIMIPKILRERMNDTWFETNFCRYINNETHYDKDQRIIKETWFYKSGEIVDDYHYQYNSVGRLIKETSKSDYSEDNKLYFYEGNSNIVRFQKSTYKSKDSPAEFYLKDYKESNRLSVSRFDTISKTDSVFWVTNFIWKKVDKRSFQEGIDSIYYERLKQINKYNDKFQIKESKFYDYKSDYDNKKLFQNGYTKYEYDLVGRIIKETQITDDKYHYLILMKNGKYVEELKDGESATISSTEYSYYNDGKPKTRTRFYQGSISNQIIFEYNKSHIVKLYYLDTWNKKENDLQPSIVIFKYKFDKHKNWVECIKNVDGKDLYIWKREIQYY